MYYMIVGWSANLGTTWDAAKLSMANVGGLDPLHQLLLWNLPVAFQAAGGGPSSLPAVNLFGNQTALPGAGLPSGFNLYLVPIPEPTSFALAGLGAAALLIFRRRK